MGAVGWVWSLSRTPCASGATAVLREWLFACSDASITPHPAARLLTRLCVRGHTHTHTHTRTHTRPVQAGETCGIVGTPGSGRTTLLHLLMRLYDPLSGTVELDGMSLVAVQPLPLRKCFGYVRRAVLARWWRWWSCA